MKKIFSMLAAVLFAGSMMAADVVKATLDFTDNTAWQLPVGSGAGITTDSAYSDGTYTIRLAATTKYYFHADGYLLFGKSGSTLTLPAFDFDVTKIVVTGRTGASGSTKQNIFVGENAVSTETTGAQGANEYAIASDYQAAGNVYVLKVTSAHNTQVTKIEIYGEGEAPAVATPVISGEAEFTDSVIVTITCSTPETDIYYTTDGTTDPKCDCAAAPEYTHEIVLKETTTIMAAAYTGNDWSAVATKTFTKVVPPVNLGEKTIAEFLTLKNVKDTCILTGVVDSIKNTTYGNLYLSDATGQVYVYGVLNADGEAKKFAELGVEVNDTLTIKAIYSEYNKAPQVKNGIFVSVKKPQGETPEVEAIVYNWAKDAASGHVGTTAYGTGTEATTFKIHKNTLSVDAIKFGSSYVYADGKYISIKPAEGGFKAGDELGVMVWFSNADDSTKYCMVDVFAADGATRLFRSDSASTVNGRLHNEDAAVQTYVLASDQDSLLIGRYGNTAMYVNYIKVTRKSEVVPPTPEHTYTVAGAPAALFGKEWNASFEENDMVKTPLDTYLWGKDSVALAPGKVEFKVVEDHAWAHAWPEDNYVLNIDSAGIYNVSIVFNPNAEVKVSAVAIKIADAEVLPTVIMHGTFFGNWADTEEFLVSDDKKSAAITLVLNEGTYEFGVKLNGVWRANGANITREANSANLATGSGNMHITADVAGAYEFVYTFASERLDVIYPAEPKEGVEVSITEGVRFLDYVEAEGWWQIMAENDKFIVSVSNVATTQLEGVYTIADLDKDFTYLGLINANDTAFVSFIDGSVTLTLNEQAQTVTVAGTLLGNDSIKYNLNLVFTEPKAKETVNVNITNGKILEDYAAYGLYGLYGADENNVFVIISVWAKNGLQGEFTEEDLDFNYLGSGVIDQEGSADIYKAAITVTPGNGDDYSVTATLLCYNNKQYNITMYIPASQGIEDVDAAVKAVKRIINDQLIIEKNGRLYNATGTVVR